MKKILATVTTLIAALTTLSLPAAETLSPGKLLIGSDLTYPPYNYLQDNKPAGFDAEFTQLLAKEIDLIPEVKDTRFASLILGLKSHKFDVIASTLYITPERAKQVDFIPYMQTGGSLLVKQGNDWQPKTPEDLCGKKVGSIKGGAWIPKLRALSSTYCLAQGKGPIDVREFPTSPEIAQALLSSAIDVQYEDAAVAKAIVDKTKQRLTISSETLLYPVIVGLAIEKDNLPLRNQLQQAFNHLVQTGDYNLLLKKYNLTMPDATASQKALTGNP